MKRVRNSGRHATMLRCELVQRLDRLVVTQNHGHLPAFGAVGGLAFRAGLGGSHRSGGEQAADGGGDFQGQPFVPLRHAGGVLCGVTAKFAGARGSSFDGDFAHVLGAAAVSGSHNFRLDPGAREGDKLGGDLIGGFVLHLCLHVGPIPTMCPSYPVTSDVSTTVRREAA